MSCNGPVQGGFLLAMSCISHCHPFLASLCLHGRNVKDKISILNPWTYNPDNKDPPIKKVANLEKLNIFTWFHRPFHHTILTKSITHPTNLLNDQKLLNDSISLKWSGLLQDELLELEPLHTS